MEDVLVLLGLVESDLPGGARSVLIGGASHGRGRGTAKVFDSRNFVKADLGVIMLDEAADVVGVTF